MKAKIVISKECVESQALKYELLGGFQRTEGCEMVCTFTILVSIVLDDFSRTTDGTTYLASCA